MAIHLLSQLPRLLPFLEVDLHVGKFQKVMRKIANAVGLDVDPVTGLIIPMEERR